MKPPQLSSRTVRQLRNDLVAKRFAIPKLQRNFVWDAPRAAKLLDSIYRDMPIGSIFLWEMDRKDANLIRHSADVLPSFESRHRTVLFVIDGQQRLSVIYQAFEGQLRQNDAGRDIDFSRLCFAVHPDADQEDPERIVYRKPRGRDFVPLKDILAPDWKRRMPGTAKLFLSRVKECRDRLLGYPIPVVTVTSATLKEIGEVFIRVNSQGMRITSADRAIAMMGQLDVRAMAHELRQKVREVFALTTVDPILMGFNLVVEKQAADGDPPKLEVMARRWSKRIEGNAEERTRFKKEWGSFKQAFLKAVEYLRSKFPVYDESYLPSANMLATLSVFFYHHRGQPDAKQASEIRKWFWATGVAQRYSGRGYHRNLVRDAELFTRLAKTGRARFTFHDYLDPVMDIQGSQYASRSARTRAFFCLLARQRPRYIENGEPIPLDMPILSHANARHRHHIYPKAQMSGHFQARVYNSLCNICFLVSRDNLAIGKRRPRSYLNDFHEESRQRFKRVMRSHLIPAGADAGVWVPGIVGSFKQFRKERLGLICRAFESEAGIKLFRSQ